MADSRYAVRCWAKRYSGRWVVIRLADGRVMTEGDVIHCLRWVNVWGPMRANG